MRRDIKPDNVLVDAEGQAKLLDFGIAKLLDPAASSAQTRTGSQLLTLNYASPEQVRGAQITTASDVYSLGALLYELLTDQGPYRLRTNDPIEVAQAVK